MPGTPIRLIMRDQGDDNPFKGRRNSTPSRLRKHILEPGKPQKY